MKNPPHGSAPAALNGGDQFDQSFDGGENGGQAKPSPERNDSFFASWPEAESAFVEAYSSNSNALKACFYETVRRSFPEFHLKTNGALYQKFKRHAGNKKPRNRKRAQNPQLALRDEKIRVLVGGAYAERSKEFHKKGAYGEHSVGSRRKRLAGILEAPAMRDLLKEELGFVPNVTMCERVLRAHYGPANPWEEWRSLLSQTIGFRAKYAGQVFIVDATGLSVKAACGRGNEKYERRWAHCGFDIASGLAFIYSQVSTSESEYWDAAMREWFFAQRHAFEEIHCDQTSKLFDGLRHIGANKPLSLPAGVLLWLAAGARPFVHEQNRPTGGAHAEANIKESKDFLNQIMVREAVQHELTGAGLVKARKFASEPAFAQIFAEFRQRINERPYRGGETRRQLWEKPSGIEARAARPLAANLKDPTELRVHGVPILAWERIVGSARVCALNQGRIRSKVNGKAKSADLTKDAIEQLAAAGVRPHEAVALTFPGGARQGDDPDLIRAIIIQEPAGNGQPRYHAVEARCAEVDEYFQDMRAPLVGTFEAKFDGSKETAARMRDADAAAWHARFRVLRPKEARFQQGHRRPHGREGGFGK